MDAQFFYTGFKKIVFLPILMTLLLISGCATKTYDADKTFGQPPSQIILAVWDFDNNSPPGGELDYLGKSFSELLLTRLASAPNIRLVEREHLRQVLEEQHLSASQLSSEETRLKLGRLAGANHMVFGNYLAVGNQIRIDVRVVEVETTLTKLSENQVTTIQGSENAVQTIAQSISTKITKTSN
jgi:curli biogenesis system outer membrane secretion channel CsgG